MQYHWSRWASWTPSDWTLEFAVIHDGEVAGTQSIGGREFAVLRDVRTGSWLGCRYQGQGIGAQMRAAVLHLAFEALGAHHAVSGAFDHNAASLGLPRKLEAFAGEISADPGWGRRRGRLAADESADIAETLQPADRIGRRRTATAGQLARRVDACGPRSAVR
jgi:RimJ/RimL family protein N-acetyltransferase